MTEVPEVRVIRNPLSTAANETAGGRASTRLREYRRKRDFSVTPEPSGAAARNGSGHSFVVQKHAATRLHYDFRLELDGVLKSWAVPKGPSLDPGEKRLAMQTEDHPVEYGSFEGVIPEGEYGGGTVLLWDQGTWEPVGDPHAGLAKGKLEFILQGKKLRGRWTLVKIRGRQSRDADKAWLLIKGQDDTARASAELDVTEALPKSVASNRTLDDVARQRDRVWHSNTRARTHERLRSAPVQRARRPQAAALPGARHESLPAFVAPQLATLVSEPPAGDEWLHEMKFDGYRVLCRIERGTVRLLSRTGKDWTDRLAAVAQAASRLNVRAAMLDGEVAVVLPSGVTSFNALQNALAGGGSDELVYFVFDLLHLDGSDLRGSPLEARKEALHALVDGAHSTVRYSDHVVGNGEAFLRQACRMALEGVVSKRRDAPYVSGRTRTWQKAKCIQEQEFVIGGFTDPEGSRQGLGALLLGVHDKDGALAYVGKVGTGFTGRAAVDLRRRLDALATRTSPFAGRPPRASRAHWVRPELVGEVEFTEWTPDGRLRHPSWKGLREDKPAGDVVRETAAAPRSRTVYAAARAKNPRAPAKDTGGTEVAGVRITHPDRVLYAPQGITKLALARFYESIADWILPHLRSRPTSLVRCPEGLAGKCFYQKHVGTWAPAALRRVQIREKTKVGEYLVVDDLAGLIGLVQIGILEIHTWNSVVERLEHPDRLVFDLDPGDDVPWRDVVDAARLLRAYLQDQGLESFLKTTGGKGLHLVVPIASGPGWDDCLVFSRAVAERLAAESPRAFTANVAKRERRGRIYLDYLRNLRGATAVAAFSTRARPGAPVSTPLAWDELGPRIRSGHYTVANLSRRLASLKSDPWAAYARTRQALPARVR